MQLSDPYPQASPTFSALDGRWKLQSEVTTQRFWLPRSGGSLDIIFIDTSPLIPRYYTKAWAQLPGALMLMLCVVVLQNSSMNIPPFVIL